MVRNIQKDPFKFIGLWEDWDEFDRFEEGIRKSKAVAKSKTRKILDAWVQYDGDF